MTTTTTENKSAFFSAGFLESKLRGSDDETRAHLQNLIESFKELHTMSLGAVAALDQNKTFDADISAAVGFLDHAIAKAEGGAA